MRCSSGDAEGQRLAGAGARLADHVGAGQGDRDGHGLDREGVGDADLGQGLDDGGQHAEVARRSAAAAVGLGVGVGIVGGARSGRWLVGCGSECSSAARFVCVSSLLLGARATASPVATDRRSRWSNATAMSDCAAVELSGADGEYRAGAVDLLGILAYGALAAFERLAEDARTRADPGRQGAAGDRWPRVQIDHFEPGPGPARRAGRRRDGGDAALPRAVQRLPRAHQAEGLAGGPGHGPTSATGSPPTSTARSPPSSTPTPATWCTRCWPTRATRRT